ncbi:MAG TPA: bifunctional phosphopantothenoylcysteine decarboxylase/phosphopantothenate--cysteine ligase CoaBC [Gemmatimonadaceae bacterium]|nr:bifunctional phosphopantothenoylcysteine decarboxylase/phosphopantothenate--cysteine ligase CoaBC [Gemmatimonadaceae bacterium]
MRGRRVVLGVTGGIASYKSVTLARLLAQDGAEVDVVMTRGAQQFVGAVTFEGVTGRRVHSDLFESGEALAHIRLAREAQVIVVAPATADFLARAAHGRADDLLSAMLLAARCPVLIVPAMNDRMWSHRQTVLNAEHLREIGYDVIEPATGPLAFDEGEGPGRMPEPEAIAAHVERALRRGSALAGKRVVVTAGSTREAIDPVRFISNYSTGRMGIAIARSAWARGADVTLIAGAIEVPIPTGVQVVRVTSTAEMSASVGAAIKNADALIMAAAPADFRPAEVAAEKIKKAQAPASIPLTATTDILASTIAIRPATLVTVGFALETQSVVENARAKLAAKQLDMIVANRAGVAGEGFGADTNRVTILSANGEEVLPLMSKDDVAESLLDRIEVLLNGR